LTSVRASGKPNKTLIFIGVLAVCGLVAFSAKIGLETAGIFVNHTPSMPLGIYRHVGGAIERGSIITFCPPPAAVAYARHWHPEEDGKSKDCASSQEPYVKYAAALSGDEVRVDQNGVHVNGGAALPGSRPLVRIRTGNTTLVMPNVIGKTWKLKDGEVWAATPEWYSMDSRYYGPVSGVRLARMIIVAPDSPETEAPEFIKKMQVSAR